MYVGSKVRYAATLLTMFIIMIVGLLGAVSVLAEPPGQGGYITCGSSVAGNLGDGHDSDYWTFDAAAGQTVTVIMARSSGDLDPYLYLAAPDGSTWEDDDSYGGDSGLDAWIVTTLSTGGTYTITASRVGGSGDYVLGLHCEGGGDIGGDYQPPPAEPTNDPNLGGDYQPPPQDTGTTGGWIACGQTVYDAIAGSNDTDIWYFDAQTGQTLTVLMQHTDGNLDPFLYLTAPDDVTMWQDDDTAGNTDAMISATAPAAGTYVITATRFTGDSAGHYSLTVQCEGSAPPPAEPTNDPNLGGDYQPPPQDTGTTGGWIACGQTVYDAIAGSNDTDIWYFDAQTGQTLTVLMQHTDGNLDPFLYLTAPDDVTMWQDDDTAGNTDAMISATAPAAGTYVITATRFTGDSAGHYSLTVQCTGGVAPAVLPTHTPSPAPAILPTATPTAATAPLGVIQPGGGQIDCGLQGTGTLNNNAPSTTWTFEGVANQSVTIRMTRTSGDLTVFLDLVAPDGTSWQDTGSYDAASGVIAEITATLPVAGTYTISAMRYDVTSGSYALDMACAGDNLALQPVSTGSIVCGQTVKSTFMEGQAGNYNWEVHRWTFEGIDGQLISIALLPEAEGNRFDHLRLSFVNPSGKSSPGHKFRNQAGWFYYYPIFETGTQTIEVWALNNQTINYTLEFHCALQCTEQRIGWGEITPDQPAGWWFFHGEANQQVTIHMQRNSGDLLPALALYEMVGEDGYASVPAEVSVASDPGASGRDFARIVYTIPKKQAYYIKADHLGGELGGNYGKYSITFECGKSEMQSGGSVEASAMPVTCGQPVLETLTGERSQQRWSFDAQPGQLLTITMSPQGEGNTLLPLLTLRDSAGTIIREDFARPPQRAAATMNHLVTFADTYEITASGKDNTLGMYRLITTCRDARELSWMLGCGESVSDHIQGPKHGDVYSFIGYASQVISPWMKRSDGDLAPHIYITGPDDQELCSDDSEGSDNATINCTLPVNGLYEITATRTDRENGTTTGSYEMGVTCPGLDPPASGKGRSEPIACGGQVGGILGRDGVWFDEWLFDAQAGQPATIRMSTGFGDLEPALAIIYNDGSTDYAMSANANPTHAADISLDYTFPQAGQYRILAQRAGGESAASSGGYELSLSCQSSASAPPQVAAVAIDSVTCGGTTNGTISAAEWQSQRFFDAQANQTVIFSVVAGGGLTPTLELKDAGGNVLASDANPGDTGSASFSYTFTNAGRYSVVVSRPGGQAGTSAGDFMLAVDCDAAVLVPDAIQVQPGAVIGQPVGDAQPPGAGQPADAQPPGAGPSIGNAPPPGAGQQGGNGLDRGPIACTRGGPASGVITDTSYFEQWTFSGTAGQQLDIYMMSTGGNLDPFVYLIAPDGTTWHDDDGADGEPGMWRNDAKLPVTLPVDGNYILRATRYLEAGGDTAGSYALVVNCSDASQPPAAQPAAGQPPAAQPPVAGAMAGQPMGATQCSGGGVEIGRLDNATWMHDWTFDGTAGQQVEILVSQVSGNLDPYLYIVAPDGTVWADDNGAAGITNFGPKDARLVMTLPVTGTYTIKVTRFQEQAGTTTGEYTLAVFCSDGQQGALPGGVTDQGLIFCMETQHSAINDSTWYNQWTLDGAATQSVVINMNRTSGNLDPYLYVTAPDGTIWQDNDSGGSPNAEISLTLPATGTYTIKATRLGDQGGTSRGDFELSVICQSGGAPPVANQPAQPQPAQPPSGPALPQATVAVNGDVIDRFIETVIPWARRDLTLAIDVFPANIDTGAATEEGAALWMQSTAFEFTGADVANADIVLTWPPDGGMLLPNTMAAPYVDTPPQRTDDQIIIDFAEGPNIGLAPNQYNPVVIGLHTVGHALGLEHSPFSESVMYPYITPGKLDELIMRDLVLQHAFDQLIALYGPDIVPGMAYSAPTFSSRPFRLVGNNTLTFALPYPAGVTSGDELTALCAVGTYWPGSNTALSWFCTSTMDNVNRQVVFTIITGGANTPDQGLVTGRALLINKRAFELVDSQTVSIRGSETRTVPLNAPAGTVVVPTVTRYEPAGAENFGYTIAAPDAVNYEVRALDGSANSMIDVTFNVFKPLTGAYYTGFAPVDVSTGTPTEVTFAQDRETAHFSVLSTYQPNGNASFGVASKTLIEALFDDPARTCSVSNPAAKGSLCLSTYLHGLDGNAQSYGQVMTYLFQLTQ